jgi:hypothetical protein
MVHIRAIYIVQLFAAVLAGCFIGMFVGLSASPAAHLVISALVSLCAAATAAVAGVQAPDPDDAEPEKQLPQFFSKFHKARVDFIPIAVLTAGLLVGASFGILARTNDLLGMRPGWVSSRWKNLTNLDDKSIASRLFDEAHPPTAVPKSKIKESDNEEPQTPSLYISRGVVFASPATAEDCDKVEGLPGNRLRIVLAGLNNARLTKLETQIKDDKDLEAAIGAICSENK